MFNKKFLLTFLFYCSFILQTSCSSNEEPAGSVVEHPIPELIPHHDRNHIPINRDNSFEELTDPSETLILLRSHLEDPDRMVAEPLELTVNDLQSLKIVEVGRGRLLFLDTDNDRLIEYKLSNDASELIAGFGRGPRELQHSIDMELVGDDLYVARRDMRLSRFNCSSAPCVYDTTMILDVQPISISLAQNGLAMTTGSIIRGGDELVQDSYINSPAVQIIDMNDGQLLESFGSVYNTRFMMVLERFKRTGLVAYLPKHKRYIWASSWFPYLYVYNENFEFEQSYKLENHIQNTFEFFPDEQKRSFKGNDYTLISKLKIIGEARILLVTTTQTKREEEQGEVIYDYSYDYYVIDLLNGNPTYLGTDKNNSGYQRMIFPFQNILIKYDSGVLYKLLNE